MSTVVVHENERGVPIPSPVVMERVRAIDPLLDLKPFRFGDNGIEWAATFKWPADDPRRARIQSGELAPDSDSDIIAFIPLRVSVDEIPAYLEKGLTAMRSANQRGYVDQMLSRIRSENQKAPDARWAKVIDTALETFETFASKASSDVIRMPSAGIPGAKNGPARKKKHEKGAA